MNQFRRALQDRPYFYLSLLFFVIGTAELGSHLDLVFWLKLCWCGGMGLVASGAVYFWGRPKGGSDE